MQTPPETQVVIDFDDNRAASALVGPYGQNLALVERRLNVVVDSRGNHITIAGSRDGCDAARRVLETLYTQATQGHDLSQGEVEGAIRAAVEAGERLGFLPGDLREKVDPFLRPIYDALYDLMDSRIVERALQTGEIEIAPLAFMRGRTLTNAAIILDEAQNTTSMQMKMFLTRLGENSRMIVTGDPSQVDLPNGQTSGLAEATRLLDGVAGIAQVKFT